MKFVISFFFLSLSAHSFPIHLYHEDNVSEAGMYKDILMKDYLIPEELISVRTINNCEVQKAEGKLDLCLKNNGDLLMVSVDRAFINESLKIFQAP